jgi:uncharacterized protein YqgV (UPF0045/DUF77 family)
MNITVDVSLYPLVENYKPEIKNFIRQLRGYSDLELVTNQLSTQIRGDADLVMAALNKCMLTSMQCGEKVVFVARYLNANLDISVNPDID